MENLKERAHNYLTEQGCLSMGQTYTAYKIEMMLEDFAQQQLNLLIAPDVSDIHICSCEKPHVVHICKNCNGHIQYS